MRLVFQNCSKDFAREKVVEYVGENTTDKMGEN